MALKSAGSGDGLPEFKVQLLPVWPWASDLISLSCTFLFLEVLIIMVDYTIRYLRLDEMWYLPKQRLMVFLTVKSLSDSLLPGVWSPTNLSHKYRAHSHLPTLSPNSTDTRSQWWPNKLLSPLQGASSEGNMGGCCAVASFTEVSKLDLRSELYPSLSYGLKIIFQQEIKY